MSLGDESVYPSNTEVETETRDENGVLWPARVVMSHAGITKREYFAAAAMQGLLQKGGEYAAGDLAYDAVRNADWLIAELSKGGAS